MLKREEGEDRWKEKPWPRLGAPAGWMARGAGVLGCNRGADRGRGATEGVTKFWAERLGGKLEGVEP